MNRVLKILTVFHIQKIAVSDLKRCKYRAGVRLAGFAVFIKIQRIKVITGYIGTLVSSFNAGNVGIKREIVKGKAVRRSINRDLYGFPCIIISDAQIIA